MTILVPLDYATIFFAGFIAYQLRFQTFRGYRPVVFDLPFPHYSDLAAIIAFGMVLVFAFAGLYTMGGRRKRLDEFKKIVLAVSTGFAGLLAVLFFSRELFVSRFIVLAAWFLVIVLVALERLLVRFAEHTCYRFGMVRKRVVVIGNNKSAHILEQEFSKNKKLGINVIGVFDHFTKETENAMKRLLPFDSMYFLEPRSDAESMHSAIDFADEHHVTMEYTANLFSTHMVNFEFSTIAGVPLVELKRTRLDGWGAIYKRIFDIILSSMLLVALAPLLLCIMLAIMLDSGFPVIYQNRRVGLHGEKFDALKFRSMFSKYCIGDQFADTKAALAYEEQLIAKHGIKAGPIYKINNDPRVTRLGRVLRRLSLDELPQLWNVLKGDMSLIGPRPHQPREVAKYDRHHKRVLDVRPGITGLPQISGRSDLEFEEEVTLDTYYIEHWSLKLDMIILLKTIFAAISQKGVY